MTTTTTRTARINRKSPVVVPVPVTVGTENTRREFRLACQNQNRADKRVERSGVAYRVALLIAHSGNGGASITSEQIDAARAEHHDAALDLPNAASMRTQWSWVALIAKVDGLPALVTLAANPGDVQKRYKAIKAEQNGRVNVGPGSESNSADLANNIKRYAANIGDGTSTSIAVTHSLNSNDVTVEVYDTATGESVGVGVTRTSANVVTIEAIPAPTTNALRVVVKY